MTIAALYNANCNGSDNYVLATFRPTIIYTETVG